MTDIRDDTDAGFPAAFAGLKPTRPAVPHSTGSLGRSLFATVPIVLVGTMAMASLNLTVITDSSPRRPPKPKAETADLGSLVTSALARASNASALPSPQSRSHDNSSMVSDAVVETTAVPSTYRVSGGDTVSDIAGRFGLSTASVLAMNGLSWKSIIFPGQELRLSKTAATPARDLSATTAATTSAASTTLKYTIKSGDTISRIAKKYGVSTQALLTANHLGWSSIIYPGQKIVIKVAATPPKATVPPVKPPVKPPVTPPATPPATSGLYTIRSGDTLTTIAKKFNVTVAALLKANGLKITSTIYAGHKLVIPGLAPASVGNETTPLSPTMSANATTIIRVGQALGVPDYGIVIALAAAAQESGLQNLSGGDRDSVGLFQQRPSTGWGTKTQLVNTTYASKLFYGGPSNPNAGKTRGLLDIKGWQSMTVTKAAQAVQISGHPDAYAKWEASARAWLTLLK